MRRTWELEASCNPQNQIDEVKPVKNNVKPVKTLVEACGEVWTRMLGGLGNRRHEIGRSNATLHCKNT